MYHPFCKRCHTRDNFGKHTCGSCQLTLCVAKELNTVLRNFNGDKTKTAKFMGVSRSNLYELMSQIPEIYKYWDGIEGKKLEEVKKVLGNKVRNKMNFTEHRLWKKILRFGEFADIDDDKKKDFVEWFYENSKEVTLGLAKEKLKELSSDVIRV